MGAPSITNIFTDKISDLEYVKINLSIVRYLNVLRDTVYKIKNKYENMNN